VGRHLGQLAGVQRLPRHRLDEATLRELPAARNRFRRLPLPGVRADWRRRCDRSGLSPGARPRPGRGARGGAQRRALRLSATNLGRQGRGSDRRLVIVYPYPLRAGRKMSDTAVNEKSTNREDCMLTRLSPRLLLAATFASGLAVWPV